MPGLLAPRQMGSSWGDQWSFNFEKTTAMDNPWVTSKLMLFLGKGQRSSKV
jgi:hypothetical protein